MKKLAALSIPLLALTACPSDDDGEDTGAETGSMTSPGTMSGATMTGATTDTDTNGETTAMEEESGPGESEGETAAAGPPVINSITWTQDPGCMMDVGSDVTVVVDVTDPDNDVSELTFSGMVIGCTGTVDAPEVTLLCPQVAPYTGEITVEDPDGNSDDLEITIDVCADGSAP